MKHLNLNAPINSLGYGVVSFNLYKELIKTTDVTLWPMSDRVEPPCRLDENIISELNRDIKKQEDFHPDYPTLKVWHENRLAERIGNGEFFALPFFEVNKFDQRRKTHLKSADKVIVTSKWASDIVEEQTGISSFIIPCGVDRSIFNEKSNKVNQEKCIFFNCGKWEIRKGHDVLHRAFKDAFPNNMDVKLWMMTENPFLTDKERKGWESNYFDPRMRLISRVKYQEELAEIISQVHCGVFPARAEGWNLELLEMMSMGKEVIATNYSAHTEFCTDENCHLVNIVEEEPMYDGKWFVGDNGTWASLEGEAYDQLVEHMRSVYRDWKACPDKVNEAGMVTAQTLSWESMARSIGNIL